MYKKGCQFTKTGKVTGVVAKSYPQFHRGDFGRKVTFQPSYPQCPPKLTAKSNTKKDYFKRLFLSQTAEMWVKKNKICFFY